MPNLYLPTRHIVPITGFKQTTQNVTGLVSLFYKMRERVGGIPDVLLWTPQTWHIDIPATVEMIRNSAGLNSEAFVIGYSYGGEKARRLVWALAEKGISVTYLFLIDPVRRGIIPGLFAALGYFKPIRILTPIELPSKVKNATVWTQAVTFPFGWTAFARDPKATYVTNAQENRPHVDMDDSPAIHSEVLACLDKWLSETSTP